jgi:excisionase family DNA binding protein
MSGQGTARKSKPVNVPPDPWVSVREAGRLLGIAPPTVLTRVVRGELEAQTVGGLVFVSRASVERAVAAQEA